MLDKMEKEAGINSNNYFKIDLLIHKENKKGIYVLFRSLHFKKAFFEHYKLNEALNLKECITLIKLHFRPTQNNYEVYKQAIKDVRKNYYIQLNKPSLKLRIGWDKTNNTISVKIKNK
jgi:hypothetical protein